MEASNQNAYISRIPVSKVNLMLDTSKCFLNSPLQHNTNRLSSWGGLVVELYYRVTPHVGNELMATNNCKQLK